ncbi:HutD family protein [Sphingobium sp. Sx8-8]|uniref:HutD/Ves family protein n=1 Tax=Sphingobium sp. Sx8-8 TaxID=2933617 RepID=UPI001F56FAE2|nr:HutD family protein [Sphingobium sp. Sx8-8]
MSAIAVLRAADRRPQRWKNGGGVTSEVVAFPPGAGMEDFDWRISIAEVAEAGPFSRFDGVDRVLTVIEGELALAFEAQAAPVILDDRSRPFAFAADAPVSGAPLDGPVRDLNVMVRRGKARATVERVLARPGTSLEPDHAGVVVLIALDGLTIVTSGEDRVLAPLDAVMTDGGLCCTVTAGTDIARLVLVALFF